MSENKVSCSRCNKPIYAMSYYCCDPIKSFCLDCSKIPCKLCFKTRTKVRLKSQNIVNRVLCVNCRDPEIKAKSQYFFESKCKEYYCPQCLMVFYHKYCSMIQKFETQHGSTLEMQVELKCGCELEKKVVVDYLSKYCELCGRKNEGTKCIQLTNKCKVMTECYDNLIKEIKYQYNTKEKKTKLRQLYNSISKNMISCGNCKAIIDGERFKLGEKIDGIFICVKCLIIAKEAEVHYSQGSQKKEKKKEQEKKGPLQLQCSQCSAIINEKINGSNICKTCYDHLDKAGKAEEIEQHPRQSKIKQVNKHEIVKVPPLVVIIKQEKAQGIVPAKQQAIKGGQSKKKKAENRIQIDNIDESDIPPSQKSESLPLPSENPQMRPQNDEFYKPSTFKLNISPLKEELKECGECGGRIQKENCFNAYQHDPGIQKKMTLRIAETQKELLRFSQEGLLKVYCKLCYMDLKMRQKMLEKRLARQAQQRRPAARGLSQPKTFKNEFNSPLQASKYQRQDDKLQKKFNLIGTAPQRFVSPIIEQQKPGKDPYIPTTICHRCSEYVPLAEYDSVRRKCRNCEAEEIEKQLKEKKEEEILKRKCDKCRKIYAAKMSELGKLKLCSLCTSDLLAH